MKSQTGFDAGGSAVFVGGTSEATVEAGVGNDTDSEGGTVSNMVTETCVRNMEQTQII